MALKNTTPSKRMALPWVAVIALCSAPLAAGAADATVKAGPSNWNDIVAAARKEGKVVVYSAAVVPLQERIKADFEAANPGITMEWVRYTSGLLVAKVDQERQGNAPGADVAISTETGWYASRTREKLLKPPVGPATATWPAKYMLYGTSPVLAMEPILLLYNTKEIKSNVSGHADMLKPEFKGRIGMLDLNSTTVVAFYDWLEKTQGAEYLPKLAAQRPKMYSGVLAGAQSVASGELGVANFVTSGAGIPLAKTGAPVKLVFPNPGVANAYAGAILANAQHPNAAQVYMNHMMSVRGQAAFTGDGAAASALPNVPGALDSSTLQPVDLSAYTPEIFKERSAKLKALFQ